MVWEDEKTVLFLDIQPIKPGHLLLIPKKHVDSLFDLSDALYAGLFKRAKKIAPLLKESSGAKRVGLAVEGFGVPHAHVHLVPINSGQQLNPERAKKMSEKKLRELQERYRKLFEQLR